MLLSVQQCWDDPNQFGQAQALILVALSGSTVWFSFSGIVHMLWWGWYTERQREASAYAFLVLVVFNVCIVLKYALGVVRPHPSCDESGIVLSMYHSGPSIHAAVATFLALFYIRRLWRGIYTPTAGNTEEQEQAREEEGDDDKENMGLSLTLLSGLVSGEEHTANAQETAFMGRWEAYARILIITAYACGVCVSRVLLEMNAVADVLGGVGLATVLFVVFLGVYRRLVRKLTTKWENGEKME